MKRLSLLIATLSLASLLPQALRAQQPPIGGVWQQVFMEADASGRPSLRVVPVWKVLGADGRFTVFAAVTEDGYGVITNEGAYVLTSDSTYTEKIERTNVDSTLVGVDNHITYHYFTPDLVGIAYRLPGADADTHEVWRRVTFRMPGRRPGHGTPPRDGRRPPRTDNARPGQRDRLPMTELGPAQRESNDEPANTGDPLFDEAL